MYNGANLEGDPRLEREENGHDFLEPVQDHQGKVTFEEYLAAAKRQREYEENEHKGISPSPDSVSTNEKSSKAAEVQESALTAEEMERINARRALRSASWAAVFYLITTDILGPFNAPYAISQTGYVPGVILYFVMGVAACYTGLLLWWLFLHLDSDTFPVKTYSDLAERIYGRTSRHIVSILQSIQLIINVGTICLSNGQSLSQISKGHLCFAVCIVIWAIVGMGIGQIRSLKSYGWLANSAVWINLAIIFISMGFVAHSPPNYAAAESAYGIGIGPIEKSAFVSLPLSSKVNGIMNMVFAYGGAMIFPEMLAEMRRPWDFWKGMCCAQLLIFVAYLLYGLFVYSYQGQYTLGLAYQGVSKYAWQTVGNVLALITGIIAAGLYGNIGIKVAYYSIVEDMFGGPPLISRAGRFIWTGMVFLYWALAFIVGAAIPQVQTISGLVAAICIMQFTYTFPPALIFGFYFLKDGRDSSGRISWYQGFFGGYWWFKIFNFFLALAALSMACLGMYGSGTAIQETFKTSQATSFGCAAPV
ncbi:amino acid transporter [Wolfiporia cocos MD-104 SS10]|uniref:Amino acid transporter n=1 Tax=Wolfiporia cocos (strain MD-104) TaxID=742152 RepID=A0A2H3IZ36_WOLCO|nr:amino acid transporter [Wolfiporia cocos MD-104 SS10]